MHREEPVWVGKPWIAPSAVIRTLGVIVVAVILFLLEAEFGDLTYGFAGLPLWGWTTIVLVLIWLVGLMHLLIFRFANTYILRQDGIEVRRGIIRLRSFLVTPMGFGDLLVYQSFGGRIFGYGDITINSQGERTTKLFLVRKPFEVADTIRDIMGKPIVRLGS